MTLVDIPLSNPEPLKFLNGFYVDLPREVLGFNYTLVKCNKCTLVYQKHILNEKNMFFLYENWISKESSLSKRKDNNKLSVVDSRVNELLGVARLLNKNLFDINILEYGMGWGDWLQTAKGLGCNVIGLDLSESRSQSTRTSGFSIISNLSDCPDNSVDFIYNNQVFEHIPVPSAVLEGMTKKLKMGGIICIKVPDGGGIKNRILKNRKAPWQIKQVHPLEHINCYNRTVFEFLAKHNNLKIISGPYRPDTSSLFLFVKSSIKHILNNHSDSQVYFQKM